MDKQRRVIFGLGAQKAGTTWLYEYLRASNGFSEPFAKELHVWDRATVPLFKKSRLSNLFMRINPNGRLRLKMMRDTREYFEYFDKITCDDTPISADITPSYAALTAKTLRQIRRGFESKDIEVRPIFIMRDPIARAVSALKMNYSRNINTEGTPPRLPFKVALGEYVKSEHCRIRSDYRTTIENVDMAFQGMAVNVSIYENMFTEEGQKRISQFAGVSHRPEWRKKFVFQSGTIHPTVNRRDLYPLFESTYQYCFDRFPETKKLWLYES